MDDYFDQRAAPKADNSAPETGPPGTAETPPEIGANTEVDTGTAQPVKAAVQELLKWGLIEHTAKPNIYRTLQRDYSSVAAILEPLDLSLQIDDTRGIAFLKIAATAATDSDEAWSHPLLRRLRLTTEQSLLVAILRQVFMAYEQESGIGAAGARIDFDELRAQFDLYLGEHGSEERNRNRLTNVLDQLHKHGIVSGPDKEDQVHIRPIIVHLSNPTQLELLLHHFRQLAQSHPANPSAKQAELPNKDV